MEDEFFFDRNGRLISEDQWYWKQDKDTGDIGAKVQDAPETEDIAAVTTRIGYAMHVIGKGIRGAASRAYDLTPGEDVVENLTQGAEAYTK